MSVTTDPATGPTLRLEDLRPPVRGLILDVDGVLWRDSQPLVDLAAIFDALADRSLRAAIATNNAMRTVEQYLEQFKVFGVTLEPWQIVTAGEATADVLAAGFPDRGPVFVVGEHGLRAALQERGFEVVTDPAAEKPYAVIVAGIDRELSYAKLHRAAQLARVGVPYFGTNPDPTFPIRGELAPGAGAMLAAINAASGKLPTVIGKPSPLLFRTAASRMELAPPDLLVVGDRLETDIAGGQAFGARTAVVLSGVCTAAQASAWRPAPDLVSPDLATLIGL